MQPKQTALAYVDAVSRKDFAALSALLAPDLSFKGPSRSTTSAEQYLAALRRLGPILVRSDLKQAVAEGADVCVVYDFVTSTPAGAVTMMEALRVEDGKIASVQLMYDRVAWKPAQDALAKGA